MIIDKTLKNKLHAEIHNIDSEYYELNSIYLNLIDIIDLINDGKIVQSYKNLKIEKDILSISMEKIYKTVLSLQKEIK